MHARNLRDLFHRRRRRAQVDALGGREQDARTVGAEIDVEYRIAIVQLGDADGTAGLGEVDFVHG